MNGKIIYTHGMRIFDKGKMIGKILTLFFVYHMPMDEIASYLSKEFGLPQEQCEEYIKEALANQVLIEGRIVGAIQTLLDDGKSRDEIFPLVCKTFSLNESTFNRFISTAYSQR